MHVRTITTTTQEVEVKHQTKQTVDFISLVFPSPIREVWPFSFIENVFNV